MPRPEEKLVTFTVDGHEITAPENVMLVDGAKRGDIEIPVFCYEPKLGAPVGACRMCLVEIEGMPKLQTACSTAVKDGMVVHTQSERVKDAQKSVVEFLLVNHPLDCPVCDKGGECPLQDVTFGWGPGISRYVEPKRHFQKPLELSPLVAIDRERCILCYRCVRFSQEVSEDYQLILQERGADSYVATFDGHPYVDSFSGNVIELCPVGALTSIPYRFRARPWDIEQSGSVCTLCPSQCNVSLTVRDDQVERVLARENSGVDDGWLCDKGRFAYQSIRVDERITTPLVREGGKLVETTWENAFEKAVSSLATHSGKIAALAGGQATNEEGLLLQRLLREGLDSHDIDSTPEGTTLPLELQQALAKPALQASVTDIEFADTVLVLECEPRDVMPVLELRIRKGARRRNVKLAVASSRPSALDSRADLSLRLRPGTAEAFLRAIEGSLDAGKDTSQLAALSGVNTEDLGKLADLLQNSGSDVVVVWGEQILSGERSRQAATALLKLAERLDLERVAGAGLFGVPGESNGRGLREAGAVPTSAPGYSEPTKVGKATGQIAAALADEEISGLYLLQADPLRTHPNRTLWEEALAKARFTVAHSTTLTETVSRHADVVFPAEAYAEKEGTVTHPDGRVQRLRPAIGHAGQVRPEWQILAKLGERFGLKPVPSGSAATALLTEQVSFYKGLTLEEIGGKGVRWQERPAATEIGSCTATNGASQTALDDLPDTLPEPSQNSLLLGRYRPLWAAPEVEISPALKFLTAEQTIELAPEDAQTLGIASGDRIELRVNGTGVEGTAKLRSDSPRGVAFAAEAVRENSVNVLTGDGPVTVEVTKL